MVKIMGILLVSLTAAVTYGSEFEYNRYRSPAALGRGDTGIASSRDEDAPFYNPALIGFGTGIYKKLILGSIGLAFSKWGLITISPLFVVQDTTSTSATTTTTTSTTTSTTTTTPTTTTTTIKPSKIDSFKHILTCCQINNEFSLYFCCWQSLALPLRQRQLERTKLSAHLGHKWHNVFPSP